MREIESSLISRLEWVTRFIGMMMTLCDFPRLDIKSSFTLGPAYSEFGYYAHLVTMSRFFPCEGISVIDSNVKEVQL